MKNFKAYLVLFETTIIHICCIFYALVQLSVKKFVLVKKITVFFFIKFLSKNYFSIVEFINYNKITSFNKLNFTLNVLTEVWFKKN